MLRPGLRFLQDDRRADVHDQRYRAEYESSDDGDRLWIDKSKIRLSRDHSYDSDQGNAVDQTREHLDPVESVRQAA